MELLIFREAMGSDEQCFAPFCKLGFSVVQPFCLTRKWMPALMFCLAGLGGNQVKNGRAFHAKTKTFRHFHDAVPNSPSVHSQALALWVLNTTAQTPNVHCFPTFSIQHLAEYLPLRHQNNLRSVSS